LPPCGSFFLGPGRWRAPSLSAATLIALTGYGSEDDRRQSRAAGFDGHLVKPIDFADLERVLGSLQGAESIPPERSRAA